MAHHPPAYKAALAGVMSYKHGVKYPNNHEFTWKELAALTSDDVVGFMNMRAFGMVTPGPNDKPSHCRSSSLEYWKKAISFFMPNKNHQWNEMTNSGNPTRSQDVNDLIKRVKRFEIRKQGAEPQARRPLTIAEIKSAMQELQNLDNPESKYGLPALLCFQ